MKQQLRAVLENRAMASEVQVENAFTHSYHLHSLHSQHTTFIVILSIVIQARHHVARNGLIRREYFRYGASKREFFEPGAFNRGSLGAGDPGADTTKAKFLEHSTIKHSVSDITTSQYTPPFGSEIGRAALSTCQSTTTLVPRLSTSLERIPA